MKFNLFGWHVEVELPADPEAFVREKVIQILNYMGYEWPSTSSGVLEGWSADWDSLGSQLETYVSDLQSGITRLQGANEGAAIDAVAAYMNSDDSNVHSLHTVAQAAPLAAKAYSGAAKLIIGLKAYVIGQILLDVVSIAAAIISGGASAAVSFLAKKGAQLAINLAIDKAINELMGA